MKIVGVGVAQVSEIDVGVGELVDEELRSLDEMEIRIGAHRGPGPRIPIRNGKRPLDRAHSEKTEHRRLRVLVPAVTGEPLLVVPSHRDSLAVVEEPLPVHVMDQAVDQERDLRVREILARHDGTGKEQPSVDGG